MKSLYVSVSLLCRQESDIPQERKLWPTLRSTEPQSEEKRVLDIISTRGLPTEAELRRLDWTAANDDLSFVDVMCGPT